AAVVALPFLDPKDDRARTALCDLSCADLALRHLALHRYAAALRATLRQPVCLGVFGCRGAGLPRLDARLPQPVADEEPKPGGDRGGGATGRADTATCRCADRDLQRRCEHPGTQ